jgi:hypothetical protein
MAVVIRVTEEEAKVLLKALETFDIFGCYVPSFLCKLEEKIKSEVKNAYSKYPYKKDKEGNWIIPKEK